MKVLWVIYSCVDLDQLASATRYAILFHRQYGRGFKYWGANHIFAEAIRVKRVTLTTRQNEPDTNSLRLIASRLNELEMPHV